MPSSIYKTIPEGAILAGHDQDQSPIYIGRAWHEGDQLPGEYQFFCEHSIQEKLNRKRYYL